MKIRYTFVMLPIVPMECKQDAADSSLSLEKVGAYFQPYLKKSRKVPSRQILFKSGRNLLNTIHHQRVSVL